jgi:hypothetical protein
MDTEFLKDVSVLAKVMLYSISFTGQLKCPMDATECLTNEQ